MHYAGIDLHKRYSYITVVDREGHKAFQNKVKNDQYAIQKALLQLNIPIKAAVEATFNAYWLVDTLADVNIKTDVTHPTKLKAIASSKIKTDKIDSETIAKLACFQLLPLAYIPTEQERELKDIVRFRLSLIQARADLKRRLSMILLKNCIYDFPYKNIFGKGGQKWLQGLELRAHDKKHLLSYLELINQFTTQIATHDIQIKEFAKENYQAKLLQSIPGVGPIISMTLVAEIGNVARFETSRHLSGYAGLIPSTYSSGGKTTHGPITKTGNKFIRYALGEAVIHTIRDNPKLKTEYEKLALAKGKSVAKVACMRKLLSYIYIMLKYDKKFEQLEINQSAGSSR